MHELWLVFIGGLLGSVHCVGMCGGFALTVGAPTESRTVPSGRYLYFVGKTLTYALLGAGVGAVGQGVNATFRSAQGLLGIAAGIFMIAIGLSLTRLWKGLNLTVPLTRLPGYRQAAQYLLRERTSLSALLLGLLNGLLPCGLVYGFLAKAAAAGSALAGAVTMAVFGAATVPALGLLMITGQMLSGSWRLHLDRASGAVVLVLGLITLWRGMHVL